MPTAAIVIILCLLTIIISTYIVKKRQDPPSDGDGDAHESDTLCPGSEQRMDKEKTLERTEVPEEPQREESFSLLGSLPVGKGYSVWMRKHADHFEMIVEYHGVSPYDSGGACDPVPDDVICSFDLQTLSDWMYTCTTPAFHIEITANEENYRQYLRECGVTKYVNSNPAFTYTFDAVLDKINHTALV